MFVGLIIRVSPGSAIQDSVSFNYQFFFNLLLPPIILASGYELHQVSQTVPLRNRELTRAGQFLPQHRHNIDVRFCWDLHFRRCSGRHTVGLD